MDYDPKHPLLQRKDRPFQKLFNVESEFMAAQGYSDSAQKARLRGFLVTIIDKLSQCSHFDAFVPYIAVNYVDRFLSRKQNIPPIEETTKKNIKLFGICCLMLAWKMRNKIFSVSEFMRINRIETNPLLVLKMEIQILNALEWRMRSVTAISFLEYFYPFFKLRHPQPIEGFSRRDITKILITIQGDIKFTKFKPSIIAASAVLYASCKAFPAQFLLRLEAVLRCQYIDEGALLPCMEAMGFEILEEVKVIKRAIKLEEEKKIEEAIKTEQAKKIEEAKKMEETMKIEQAKKMEEAKKIEDQKEAKDINEKLKAYMEEQKIEKEKKMEEARKIEKEEDINEKLKAYMEEKKIEKAKKMEEERKIEEAKRMEEMKGTEEEKKKEVAKEIEKEKERYTKRKMGGKKTEEAKKIEKGVDIKNKDKGTVTGIKIGEGKKTEEGVDIKDKGKGKVDEGVEAKKPKTDPTKAEAKRRPRRQRGKKVRGLGSIQEGTSAEVEEDDDDDDDYDDYESSQEEEEDVVMNFKLNWPVAELEGELQLNAPDLTPREQRAAAARQPTASPNQPKCCPVL